LNAKAFSDWSTHIVASNRAKVNDSEPVDAFGKVENFLRSRWFFSAGKMERKMKNRAETSAKMQK
jgi:hypothetical protein